MPLILEFSDPPEDLLKEFADGIEEGIKALPEFQPHAVVVTSDHAAEVEFGTRPYSGTTSSHKKGKGNGTGKDSDVLKRIIEWYKARSGVSDEQTARYNAYAIYRKVMNYGMPPQPFIRPALHQVEAELENGGSDADSIEDLAYHLRDLMIRNLEDNFTLYGNNEIERSILVMPLKDATLYDDEQFADITEDMWASDYMDTTHSEERAKTRKENRGSLRFK